MIYLIERETGKLFGTYTSIKIAKDLIKRDSLDESLFIFTEDVNMKYVSRITYVDGEYVYNNVRFWTYKAPDVMNNFEEYSVKDIMGHDITKDRFSKEYYTNTARINSIDGRPGQISYNMEVGKEFVSLFREECILTKFTKESDTSPMIIFEKLTPVIAMLDAGAFREAKQYLQGYRAKIKDDFLTDERIDKYIAMLDAADAIEYATDEDYFYTVPE